jgi:hypothetical protein
MSTAFTSWKEIAAYLGKGVRTVQRWETQLGLPVRRPQKHNKGFVLALPEEIDEWLRSVAAAADFAHGAERGSALRECPDGLRELELDELIRRNRQLRLLLAELRSASRKLQELNESCSRDALRSLTACQQLVLEACCLNAEGELRAGCLDAARAEELRSMCETLRAQLENARLESGEARELPPSLEGPQIYP